MKLIRTNTFETNSSSTHAIAICSEDTYLKWQNGDLYYDDYTEQFYDKKTRDEMIKKQIIKSKAKYNCVRMETDNGTPKLETSYTYKGKKVIADKIEELFTKENLDEITEEEIEQFVVPDNYCDIPLTMEEYNDYVQEYYTYEKRYTTRGGERIVAFGYYGDDF